jgi:spore maturation protein CgeB
VRWLFACALGEGRTKNGVDLGRALEAQGERVEFFDIDARPALAAAVPKGLRGERWRRSIEDRLNESLSRRLRERAHDVLVVVKGLQIEPRVVREAADHGLATVGMWIDDPLDIARSIERAPAFDLYLTNDADSVAAYRARGHPDVHHFPGSADPALFFPRPGLRRDIDLSFVGTRSDRRAETVDALRGFRTHVFGSGWAAGDVPEAVVLGPKLLTAEFNAVINRSRINVNVHRWFGRGTAMNLRLFEVPAAGGFLLTDWVSEIDDCYVEDRHLACWRSFEELRDKAAFYLAHDAARERIARAGHEHFIARHSYRERARWLRQRLTHRTIGASVS